MPVDDGVNILTPALLFQPVNDFRVIAIAGYDDSRVLRDAGRLQNGQAIQLLAPLFRAVTGIRDYLELLPNKAAVLSRRLAASKDYSFFNVPPKTYLYIHRQYFLIERQDTVSVGVHRQAMRRAKILRDCKRPKFLHLRYDIV